MKEMLPLFVSVEGATVVVTGSGPTASAVAARLASLGARVLRPDAATAADLVGALLLVAASDDPEDDEAILAAARERNLVAASAVGPSGPAFLGAFARRGAIGVAVTTRGRSPELEERLAAAAAQGLSPHDDRMAEILASIRAKLEMRIPDEATRAAVWQQILDSPVALLLQSGADDEAVEMAERMAWGTG